MKQFVFLLLFIPSVVNSQRQIPTSPDWFIVDSAVSIIPMFNTVVLKHAKGYNFICIDSSEEAVTYTYRNNKNGKLDVFYKIDVGPSPSTKTIKYFGLTAPTEIMIDFYNGYLGTNVQSCEDVCYIQGRTFVYHDQTYIARANQQINSKGRPNGYASVSFSASH